MTKRQITGDVAEGLMENDAEQSWQPSLELSGRHRIEEDVQRELLGDGGLRFSSLVVRRVPNGVCLVGVLESDDADTATANACGLARRVAGVQQVLNHLVVHRPDGPPPKG